MSGRPMTTDQQSGRQFLEEVERHHEPALAVIRGHPFVTNVAEGLCPLNDLRYFALAAYWYMRGGVKHFAPSILNSQDLETQRFFHGRLSGELEYLSRFRPFMQAVGLTDNEVERESPPKSLERSELPVTPFCGRGTC